MSAVARWGPLLVVLSLALGGCVSDDSESSGASDTSESSGASESSESSGSSSKPEGEEAAPASDLCGTLKDVEAVDERIESLIQLPIAIYSPSETTPDSAMQYERCVVAGESDQASLSFLLIRYSDGGPPDLDETYVESTVHDCEFYMADTPESGSSHAVCPDGSTYFARIEILDLSDVTDGNDPVMEAVNSYSTQEVAGILEDVLAVR